MCNSGKCKYEYTTTWSYPETRCCKRHCELCPMDMHDPDMADEEKEPFDEQGDE